MHRLAEMARRRGIQALGIVDHGRKGIRFGIDPIPGILGYTKDLRSLHTTGLDAFFDDLHRVRRAYPDMAIFAGTESISGYTWTGIPFRNLVLHNSERMLITLGEERPAQIKALPSFTLHYVRGVLPVSIVFWSVAALVVLVPVLLRRKWPIAGLLLALYAVLIVNLIYRSPVHPDVDLLAAAHKQGRIQALNRVCARARWGYGWIPRPTVRGCLPIRRRMPSPPYTAIPTATPNPVACGIPI